MNISIVTKAIEIYKSENSLSYGFNIIGDIDENNYSKNVKWNNGIDENGVGIPMEAPITWSDLQPYVTKAEEYFNSLPTKEDLKNLKASAKTKLMAGEPLTEEEANVMLGG